MLMIKNVNNDVRKDSPITETPVIRTAAIKILGKNKQTLQMFD